MNACSFASLPHSAWSRRKPSVQRLRQYSCATGISWLLLSGACSARHLLLSPTKQEKSADVENVVVKYDPSGLSYKIVQPLMGCSNSVAVYCLKWVLTWSEECKKLGQKWMRCWFICTETCKVFFKSADSGSEGETNAASAFSVFLNLTWCSACQFYLTQNTTIKFEFLQQNWWTRRAISSWRWVEALAVQTPWAADETVWALVIYS